MSCPYYTWRSDFYCTKQHNYVNEDVYYKYCRNYDYSGCPVYGDRQQIFQRIYDDVVCPCVLRIKQKQYHKAWKRYRNMVETLKKEYG